MARTRGSVRAGMCVSEGMCEVRTGVKMNELTRVRKSVRIGATVFV